MDLGTLKNPFRNNVVQDAWQTPADVADIHDQVFRECLAGIESASRSAADSLLIYGPAGSGKTHLLTRLQRHLAETAAAAPDKVLRCVFVFVRLQTSPPLLWQHVRRRLASDFMRRDQGVTQLQRLVAHQVNFGAPASPRARVMHFRVLSGEDHETLATHLHEVARSRELPRDLCVVLEHLVCNRYVRDASAWLAGESLPESVLAQLRVGPDTAEDREAEAREIVTALCRLAGETLPIVFCFDQVEALQRGIEDHDAFFRFGRVAAELFDADANVFLITCLQSALFEVFKAAVRDADRDRMMRRHAILQPLNQSQVERLIASRLGQVPELQATRNAPFYPLSTEFVARLAQQQPCVPRRVLADAARAFEELQHRGNVTRLDNPSFLRKELDRRRAAALRDIGPADTTRILLQGLEPAATIRGLKRIATKSDAAEVLLESDRKIAIEICNEADGRSLGPRLRRLLDQTPRPDGARSVIVRDPRLPISKNAVKTRGYLDELRKRGVSIVEPTIDVLAALAALSELLADAKSGDLANDGTAISDSTVLEWLRTLRADLLLEPVQEFVQAIVSESTTRDSLEDDLGELLLRERAMTAEAASAHLCVAEARIVQIARARNNRFLVLEGPPTVLLDTAGVAAVSEGLQ
jgi:hypothetical protein